MPGYLNFEDVAAQTHNNELIPMVQEIMRPTTMLADATWKQSTDMLRNVTGLKGEPPRGQWVTVDEGVSPNKSSNEKINDEMGILEAWSEVNEKTMNISPNPDALRWSNDKSHLEGMGFDLEEGLIYGNREADIRNFEGFMPRLVELTDFRSISKTTGLRIPFVTLDAGGAAAHSNSSMLLVVWGGEAANMLYPRFQSNNGIQFNHFGYENMTDENGKIKRVARSQFICTAGLSVANRRAVVRIANIESDLSSLDDNMPKLVSAMYQAYAAFPAQYKSRVRVYTNAEVILALRQYYAGRVSPATYHDAIPQNAYGDVNFDSFVIRQCDSMLATEPIIS